MRGVWCLGFQVDPLKDAKNGLKFRVSGVRLTVED